MECECKSWETCSLCVMARFKCGHETRLMMEAGPKRDKLVGKIESGLCPPCWRAGYGVKWRKPKPT